MFVACLGQGSCCASYFCKYIRGVRFFRRGCHENTYSQPSTRVCLSLAYTVRSVPMSNMPWFRAYTEMVDDEKLRLLAFEDRWHFVALLCLKGQGILDGDDPLLMRKVAVKLGLDMRTLEEVIRRLAEVGLIDSKTLQPLAWESRQMRSDADPTNAERQRRYRARKNAESVSNGESNALRNASITQLEEDTDTEEDKEKNKPAPAARARPFSVADLVAMGVDEQVASEFLVIRKRKRAPLTPLAFDGIRREAGRAGITL